jgi:hypothetical protein
MSEEEMHIYRFEVIYANKYMTLLNNFMKFLGLGMDMVATKSIMTFSTKKDVNISDFKEYIKEGYVKCKCVVYEIEGGKVE